MQYETAYSLQLLRKKIEVEKLKIKTKPKKQVSTTLTKICMCTVKGVHYRQVFAIHDSNLLFSITMNKLVIHIPLTRPSFFIFCLWLLLMYVSIDVSPLLISITCHKANPPTANETQEHNMNSKTTKLCMLSFASSSTISWKIHNQFINI